MARKNPYEMLLDENNNDNVVFHDADGNPMEFEQIALIPLDDEKYVILHPLDMGYGDDEVVAYHISSDENSYELLAIDDEDLLEQLHEEYLRLYKKSKK
ncbi:MAG: DUF1292 domain-containing protein [Erysipelotrichaceae bacterium]|nr:DUF1292 domain-containing protein [Erysipelotrichaceae bacterium]